MRTSAPRRAAAVVLAFAAAAASAAAEVRPSPRLAPPIPAAGWSAGRRVFAPPPARRVEEPARVGATGPCEAQIARAARRHGVPASVLHAVGLTETGRRGRLSPLALNIDGATYFPADAAAALARFEAARAAGAKFIDLGCMQINHRFHGAAFASPAAMLDPARNVDYAARFLSRLRAREGSWTLAVARYNAGPNNERAQTRYVCAVIAQLVRRGHGSWTDSARAFCAGPP